MEPARPRTKAPAATSIFTASTIWRRQGTGCTRWLAPRSGVSAGETRRARKSAKAHRGLRAVRPGGDARSHLADTAAKLGDLRARQTAIAPATPWKITIAS